VLLRTTVVRKLRIPIFIKFTSLATLGILVIISTISMSVLSRQRQQYTRQLIKFGATMARYVATNSPEDLLEGVELSLYQLVSRIAKNEEVVFALICNNKGIVQAHSDISLVGSRYLAPAMLQPVKTDGNLEVHSYHKGDETLLLFSVPVMYQKVEVGEVYLALTTRYIEDSISNAKVFIFILTLAITITGIAMSMILSLYFSRPIQRLVKGVEEIGKGNLTYRVNLARNDELGDLAEAFNRMAEDLRLKERIQTSFGRYVTPEIVERILASPDDEWLKGARLETTVVFVDIRGFTSLAERTEPEMIVELLNSYFTLVTDVIIKHGGYLDKFVGDSVMGVFGALAVDPLHPERAVQAAVEVRQSLVALNQKHGREADPIHVGIGINTGEVVAGNLGSNKRMEYTVIGDNVNVASRLTDLAGLDEILISEQTYLRVKDNPGFALRERGNVEIKGRQEPVKVYEVLDYVEQAVAEQ